MESATTVQNLCGVDVDTFIPSSLTDSLQRHAYSDDLYGLLAEHEKIEQGKDLVNGPYEGLVEAGGQSSLTIAQNAFVAKWGCLPDRKK